jgi:hypothetical protein
MFPTTILYELLISPMCVARPTQLLDQFPNDTTLRGQIIKLLII